VSASALAVVVDGHTHITNRMYWERIDPWEPQPFGFDFARASASGVNVVIENVAPYGYGNFDRTPKQTLRLVETALRYLEGHSDRMALALTGADIRAITASGRLAVVLGVESGFDHDGDPDVLRAFYRLGVRAVQFATHTCFNAFADAEIDGPPRWNGVNGRGRELIAEMNQLGLLIDIHYYFECLGRRRERQAGPGGHVLPRPASLRVADRLDGARRRRREPVRGGRSTVHRRGPGGGRHPG